MNREMQLGDQINVTTTCFFILILNIITTIVKSTRESYRVIITRTKQQTKI